MLRQRDDIVHLQPGKRAADGFNGQAKIVRNIGPAHVQRQRVGWLTGGGGSIDQVAKERCGFFQGIHAAQEQHVILRHVQSGIGHGQQPSVHFGRLECDALQIGNGKTTEADIGKGDGVVGINIPGAKSDELARQNKAGNLPPAVRQEFGQAEGALQNGEE